MSDDKIIFIVILLFLMFACSQCISNDDKYLHVRKICEEKCKDNGGLVALSGTINNDGKIRQFNCVSYDGTIHLITEDK